MPQPLAISRQRVSLLGLAVLVAAGVWIRTLSAGWLLSSAVHPFSWQTAATVNLYFIDGTFLFPVSRRLPAREQLPRAAPEARLARPGPGTGASAPSPEQEN